MIPRDRVTEFILNHARGNVDVAWKMIKCWRYKLSLVLPGHDSCRNADQFDCRYRQAQAHTLRCVSQGMVVQGLVALRTVARVAGPATCRHAPSRLG